MSYGRRISLMSHIVLQVMLKLYIKPLHVYNLIKGVRRALKGTVKRWLTDRGYGFIEPEEGDQEVFVHNSEIQGARWLKEGQKVEFEVQRTDRGLRAIKVKIIE